MTMICSSCKKDVSNKKGSVSFLCPNCGKAEIVRCVDCRKRGTKYVCPVCGFVGP
ncbi:MAG: Zn-ribbon RNA-binding protein [Candidatus Woesearchaeota archaeon]|nr:Zn-ribbon RNA-binding protein [Candidatus Woesearchaeota archaeon]